MKIFHNFSKNHGKGCIFATKKCLRLAKGGYILYKRSKFSNLTAGDDLMKFNTIGRKVTISDKITDYLEKKIGKLDKFFREESEARVVIGAIKEKEYVEASVYAAGMIYRAEVIESDVFCATDKIVDVIERQIRKNKTRLEKKIKREAVSDNVLINGNDYIDGEDDSEFKIVKRKRFHIKPMSAEEAVLQMNLLGHNFFVFRNKDTDEMNVVYKRNDGYYALIESV